MASSYQRKDSPFYWITYRNASGFWKQKSSRVRVGDPGAKRKVAQMVAAETVAEQCADNDGPTAVFSRWVPQWLEYRYTNQQSATRVKNSWAHLSVFFRERKVAHPAEVTYGLCHEFMRWRTAERRDGKKPAGWNSAVTDIRILGAIMQQAQRRGFVVANPCVRLGIPKAPSKPKRAITREEEALIIASLKDKPEWMLESFLVAMKQGCRASEVAVPLDRIDQHNMTVSFWIKGGRFHAAPLHESLLPLVKKAIAERRATLVVLPKQTSPRWLQFFRSIGLGDLCFHCTRVTVVTRLCEAGFSESQTMAYVGHSSELVHSLYRKMRPKAVAALGAVL